MEERAFNVWLSFPSKSRQEHTLFDGSNFNYLLSLLSDSLLFTGAFWEKEFGMDSNGIKHSPVAPVS